MSSSRPAAYFGRRRTKTFTGCWTCRSRKVKCDETRPCCSPCKTRGLDCQGYGVRLQWMHHETVALSESNLHDAIGTANDASSPRSLRRQVPVSIVQQVLESSHIEGILKLIDSVEPASTASVGDDVHINVENFGVFGAKARSNIDPQHTTDTFLMQDALTAGETCDEEPQQIPGKDLDLYNSSTNLSSPEGPQIWLSPSHSEAEAAWELCNLHVQQHLETETGGFGPGFAGDHSSDLQDQEPHIEISSSSSTHQPWLAKTVSTELPRPPVSLISQRERFLMHHYMHRVINIFCVIDNAKSPWKTIHLPRAIQGAGELSVMGATSRIRNALRNALLSISAYYFSNVQTSDRRLRAESKWVEAATLYRYNAIGLLKQAVEVDLHSPRRPKYKEFLATMLSMITINVSQTLLSS
ncbi:fungal-specific transcription factor domain-containing protein [Colletotrichum godetiae]|uniref:Fungal-specific transcription factor domain-containing protein n=1 Tax=Colletotrichum godetiae TaxID=1209918 RepID=A0AAJ0ERU8_9PEZI|nr:fungal-specific transcription factor domain-containing protein [Colletotrichum godetiae]KAK1658894.1 fungal-specific transcription factor domain-containing protein [Colletotrichum godetiae]